MQVRAAHSSESVPSSDFRYKPRRRHIFPREREPIARHCVVNGMHARVQQEKTETSEGCGPVPVGEVD